MSAQYSNPYSSSQPPTEPRVSSFTSHGGSKGKTILAIISLAILLAFGWFFKERFLVKPGMMTVIGEGKVQVKPDLVKLTVSWVGQGESASEALKNEKTLYGTLMKVLSAYGVKEENVQIAYARIIKSTVQKNSYQAINAMDVELRSIDKLDQVIGSLYSNGAYSIANVAFGADNPDKLEEQAISKAIKDAKTKAKKTASVSGKRLGRLVSLTTSATGRVSALTSKAGGSKAQQEGGLPKNQAFSGNQIEVARRVSIVYEIK